MTTQCLLAQVHVWPNFGEIRYNSYKDVLAWCFGSLLAVTSTFDLLTPKSNEHIYEAKYICDQNWVQFPLLVSEIWSSQGFRVIACCDLDPKSNQHIYEPKCICDQNRVILPSFVFEIWCSQDFWDAQTHRLTHGWTHPKTEGLQYQLFLLAKAQWFKSMKICNSYYQKHARTQWRINHEAMEARASRPQFLGQKSAPHSDSVEIFEVINLYNRTV